MLLFVPVSLIYAHRHRSAERTKMQVCSPEEYDRVMARLETIPSRVKHLIVQLGLCPIS
jgi:hypothetical protein